LGLKGVSNYDEGHTRVRGRKRKTQTEARNRLPRRGMWFTVKKKWGIKKQGQYHMP